MKAKIILGILSFLFVSSVSLENLAQSSTTTDVRLPCRKQNFCPDHLGDFEYKSQTKSARLAPGDTVRTKVVVYSEQITRILVCGDNKLGSIKFKIYDPITEYQKYVKDVKKTEEQKQVYAKDENGNTKKDDWGDPIIEYETVVNYDTIWGRKKVYREELLFQSSQSKPYWQKDVQKSKRLIIEAIIPKADQYYEGCVNVRVGYKLQSEKTFK